VFEAIIVQADVSSDDDCKKLVQETINAFGKVDILVNNAGTTKFADHSKLDKLNDEDFINIYKVNVIGPYQMIRAVEPIMKENGFGSVVNISSIAGKTGIGSSIAYAASKGALNTMTLSLAKALGPEIRVNTVCPGFIGTGWFENRFGKKTFDRIKKDQESITPLNKAGTPDDIADSAVFFCLEGGHAVEKPLCI
jgi:3-oxoacyl-[acyl-carrier protein] reductase